MERFVLPARLARQMLEHACASPCREVCGLVAAAASGGACRCLPIPNVAADPQRAYRMDPASQIAAFRDMRERGERLCAIYHSHPQGPAAPSVSDVAQAAYPEALYLIVSLRAGRRPRLRGFRIRSGAVRAVGIVLEAAGERVD